MNAGYDINSIKSGLLKYGYTLKQIDQAVNEIYHPNEVKHVIHFAPTTLIMIAVIVIGVIGISATVFFLLQDSGPDYLMDVSLSGIKTSVKPGDVITFNVEFENKGSEDDYDIELRHEIRNSKNYQTLAFEEETRAVSSGSYEKSIIIPEDAEPGDYILRTISTYYTQTASATLQIKILEDDAVVPEEPIEPTDPPITPEEDTEPVKPPEIEEPKEVGDPDETGDYDSFEALEKVKEVAQSDPSAAANYCPKMELQATKDLCYGYVGEAAGEIRYCDKIQDERTKDNCIKNVASAKNDPSLCEQVGKEDRRDICYMTFVTDENKDFSVCEKVVNPYLRQSCESLKQLSEINPEDLAFYQELINQKLLNFELE